MAISLKMFPEWGMAPRTWPISGHHRSKIFLNYRNVCFIILLRDDLDKKTREKPLPYRRTVPPNKFSWLWDF
jgi:hypothetical protein